MTQTNDNFDRSDDGILNYLQSIPHRLQTFLLEVPINQLRNALEEKERLQDLRYLEERNRSDDVYKYNVLDYTLNGVIKANYDEKIINYFQFKLATQRSRLQNHPQFGMRLVSLYPERYYVGDHSSHINHAQEIEELYGVQHREQQSSNDEDGSDANGNEPDINEDEQDNRQNVEQSNNQHEQISAQEEEEFIVEDSAIEEEHFDIIDDLQAKLKDRKRRARNKKDSQRSQSATQKKSKPIRKLRIIRKNQQDSSSESEHQNKTNKRMNRRNMVIQSQDDS